jgi:hypothetical protein
LLFSGFVNRISMRVPAGTVAQIAMLHNKMPQNNRSSEAVRIICSLLNHPKPGRGILYNRDVKSSLTAAAALIALLTSVGCAKKDTDNNDAVKQGVMKYLSKRSDLAAMDVSVPSVQFRGNEADAKVHFQAKNNSSPAAAMDIMYVLERKGDEWVVKGRNAGGGGNNPHGAPADGGSSMPPGHPSVAPGAAPAQNMPELPQIPKKK